MFSLKLLIVLMIGTVLMWIPILIQSRWYKLPVWKTVPVAILLTIFGTIGTYIWYYIENLGIGRSFYGAVFLVPLFFLIISKIMRISYGMILDLCAPAECIMLSIMKIQCLVDGCCAGKALFTSMNGVVLYFPSQLVEMGNAIIVFAVLITMARSERNRGLIYPMYMLIYGITRFVLNYFRANTSAFLLGLSAGSFWSICAIIIGSAIIAACKTKIVNTVY